MVVGIQQRSFRSCNGIGSIPGAVGNNAASGNRGTRPARDTPEAGIAVCNQIINAFHDLLVVEVVVEVRKLLLG